MFRGPCQTRPADWNLLGADHPLGPERGPSLAVPLLGTLLQDGGLPSHAPAGHPYPEHPGHSQSGKNDSWGLKGIKSIV